MGAAKTFAILFWRAVVWAFWPSLKLGTALGSGVWFVLGVYLTKKFAKEWGWFVVTVSNSAYEPALIAIGAFLFLFVVRLLAAPYVLWKAERNSVKELEEKLRPKIRVTALKETVITANFERTSSLEIINDSGEMLPDCLAKITNLVLKKINGISGEAEDVSSLYVKHLPIAVRTAASTAGNKEGPFRLRAGEKKQVMICCRIDAMSNQSDLRFNFEPGNLPFVYQVPHFVSGEIEVTIFGAATPTVETLYVSINTRGELLVKRNG